MRCANLVKTLVAITSVAQTTISQNLSWPVQDVGLGDNVVQWDHFSLIYKGDRQFLFGGEFHPWRIPVPEVWEDILEKIKAMGMNTMSYYSHWGYHAPSADVLEFQEGAHNLKRLHEMAKQVGLFVHARPGPYINAESSAGGLPLWTTTGAYGPLRDNTTAYTEAWKPYMQKIAESAKSFQVTQNGTILLYQLENEFPKQWSNVAKKTPNPAYIDYMKQLEAHARDNGMQIPFTHNMPGQSYKSWSSDYDTVGAGGDINIYGLDNYPTCWSCIPEDCSSSNPSFTVANYVNHFNEVSPKQPSMMPEFQGGAMNPWDGPEQGCDNKTDRYFVNLYYRDTIAQRVTILGIYMIYGGTNWGWLAAPFVPTSYGYSAAISENRTIGTKYYEIKSLALMTRVVKDLRKTSLVANSTNLTDNSAITTLVLQNPDTNAHFYSIRHTDPGSQQTETMKLSVNTTEGSYIIPQKGGELSLEGRTGKILPTSLFIGGHLLVYSTAEVLSYLNTGRMTFLALWVPNGEGGEFMLKGVRNATVIAGTEDHVRFVGSREGLVVNFQSQQGLSIIDFPTENLRVLLMDRNTAHRFWVPALDADPTVPVEKTVFVLGPYLVRKATVTGKRVELLGDSIESTEIEVFVGNCVNKISWNGKSLQAAKTRYGSLKATIDGPRPFLAPKFGTWKVRDALPERFLNYSARSAAWVIADHLTTPSTTKSATLPYLYLDEHGFHNGHALFRGQFNGSATSVYIKTQGGIAHGWSAFLNGHFVGSYWGRLDGSTGPATLQFNQSYLTETGPNILLIVMDNSGHDQTSGAVNVRGIINATLTGNAYGFSSWKIAGTAGGSTRALLDPVRTQCNEGGLAADRLGWHLPGFDDSSWEVSRPDQGFPGAGFKVYRTSISLQTPPGHDVSLSVKLDVTDKTPSRALRAYLYVNGYQYGRYYPYLNAGMGTFPVPPGVWNYNGINTVAVTLWGQSAEGAAVDVQLLVNYVLTSSFNAKFDGEYLRPGWEAKRLEYL